MLSHIGSFTNIRGGDVYPGLIRKTERKPIRVILQDGAGDSVQAVSTDLLDKREALQQLAAENQHHLDLQPGGRKLETHRVQLAGDVPDAGGEALHVAGGARGDRCRAGAPAAVRALQAPAPLRAARLRPGQRAERRRGDRDDSRHA